MKVVIDANIFCEDYFVRGSSFKLLLNGLQALPGSLHIPEVVIDEVVNRYGEDLAEAIAKENDHRSKMGRLFADPARIASLDVSVKTEKDSYRRFLESTVREHGEVIPYPSIPHKTVVARDLERRKPFGRDGSGYRDCLIWESVRSLVIWGTEHVIFITNNSKDFGEGPKVHPDLQPDIRNVTNVQLFRSVRAFNEAHMLPRLKLLEDVKQAIQADPERLGLMKWLSKNALDLLREADDLGWIVAGFPSGVGSVYPTELVSFTDIQVHDVRELSPTEKVIDMRVTGDFEFSVDIDWNDYINHPEVREWAGEDSEEFALQFSHHVQPISIELELTIDLDNLKVTSYEVVSIDGY